MNKNNIKIPGSFYRDAPVKIKNPIFVLRNISMCYGGNELFSDVNLTVNSDDRIAVVGPNGTGKSTLLKIIIELEEAEDGNINKSKDLRIGYLPQETHWKSLDNTLLEEIRSLDLKGQNDRYRCKGLGENLLKAFGFSEETWERKIQTLSGGEKTKLALVKILIFKPNLLVLDEPTNHLDLETIEWLEEFLLGWPQAIICVSHDRYFLDKICKKTFELNKQGLEKYYCPYSQYLEEKEKRFEIMESAYAQQQKYFKKQQVFIDRFRAKATKAKAVQNRIKQLEKLDKKERPGKAKEMRADFGIKERTCTKVLEMNDLAVGRPGLPLFRAPGRIEVDWGDKIGIIGRNGIGKSFLLKSFLGQCSFPEGKAEFGPGIKIGYYAQAHEELDPGKNILEEVASKTPAAEEKIRSILGCLLFTQDDVTKKVDCLSGGERARVALAELILQQSNLLLLDEPTNHLDLPSKEVVTNMLKEFKGTILLVSHDRYILDKVCNNIWGVKDGKLKQYVGNYGSYRQSLEQ